MSPAFKKLWGAPIVLGALSLSGLLAGLVSDGIGDWWCWLGLGLPVAAIAWYLRPGRAQE